MSDRRRCSIVSCPFSSQPIVEGVRLFGLPKDQIQQTQWRQWISIQNKKECNTKNIFICSNHFLAEEKGNRRLKRGAVPSVSVNDNGAEEHLQQVENYGQEQQDECVTVQPVKKFQPDQRWAATGSEDYSSVVTIDMRDKSFTVKENNDSATSADHIQKFCMEYSSVVTIDMKDKSIRVKGNNDSGTSGDFIQKFCAENDVSEVIEVEVNISDNYENTFASGGDVCLENQVLEVNEVEVNSSDNNHDAFASGVDASLRQMMSQKNSPKVRVCAVVGCTNNSHHNNVKLFTFPQIIINKVVNEANLQRCKNWLKFTGNLKLSKVKTTSLHMQYYICSKHFSANQFYNKDQITLLPNQTPTEHGPQCLDDAELGRYPNLGLKHELFSESHDSTDKFHKLLNECSVNDKYYKDFMNEMNSFHKYSCLNCKEIVWSKQKLKTNCLHKNNCFKYSKANNMDPGEVPEELKNLTMIEEALISPVHAMLSIYKLKGHQFGYSGNVINFPQSVSHFAQQLPHKISDLPSIITVRTQSGGDTPKDFHVRSQVVFKALSWLIKNNELFSDITISEENMALLPENGNVYDSIPSVITGDKQNEDGKEEESTTIGQYENGDDIDQLFVPKHQTNNQNDQIKEIFNWPTMDGNPMNEFKDKKIIAGAFPTLFPYGIADLRDDRDHKISNSDYFQHMLRFHDGRFAKHPKFRFYAMNSLMRWNAIDKGSLYVKDNEELSKMNVEELKKYVTENPNALNKIMYQCSNMRGTKPYWKVRQAELEAMIEQIGIPTLFFTLSAADLHWSGLFKVLAPHEDLVTMTEKRRRELVAENPILVDKYFTERVNAFLQKVVRPKFQVTEYWYRVEYQHRGSPHVHGLLWLDKAPDVTNLSQKSANEIQQVVDFFDEIIYCQHPDINAHPPVIHPCRKELEDVIDLKQDLAELLNTVQRHTRCTLGYCLRQTESNTNNSAHRCRFKFPKDLKEKSELKLSESGEFEMEIKRNDPRLNNYNPDMILIWRANMDVAPVLSKRALINYLAKYVSKAETKSKTLEELFQEICESNDKGAKNVIQRLYMKVCSERDYSAQEVGHILMSEKMVKTSRSFVHLYLKSDSEWVKVKNQIKRGESLLEKYSKRSNDFEHKSLWYMAKNYNFQTKKMKTKNSIVVVYPKITFKEERNSNDNFYRMQLLLHVPWRDINQFQTTHPDASWESIYTSHVDEINISMNILTELGDIEEQANDETEEFGDFPSGNITTEDWMAISAMLPNQKTKKIELGRRGLDQSFDWSTSYDKYVKYGSIEELQCFIANQKKVYEPESIETSNSFCDVQFNAEQTKVLNLLDSQIDVLSTSNNFEKLPKTLIVQGSAGTGKSLIIKCMKWKIEMRFGIGSVLVLAPTGVAALNIEGATIHSKLHIIPKQAFAPLQNASARKFCNDMKDVKFVIIDEYSMVGFKMLGMMSQRLKQATGSDEPFGGLCVYFFGDILQLPPVIDTPVYSDEQLRNILAIQGKVAFESINNSMILTEVHRQEDLLFKNLLKNISNGEATTDDYNVLKTRFVSNISAEEREKFKDALKLFPLRKFVDDTNLDYLEKLRDSTTKQPVPIAIIPAKFNCPLADKELSEETGLSKTLYLCSSAKLMLRHNFWTKQGLVNGSVGTLIDIVYDKGKSPPDDSPSVLICRFDIYKGPYLDNDESLKLVPIPVITKSWTSLGGENLSITQFPVVVASSITVHKSQGLTLDWVSINIGDKTEQPSGITFVALSRAKSLSRVLLQPFPIERLFKINDGKVQELKRRFLERLREKMI